MNHTDNRRAGMYWVNNQPYVSVTECLKIIAKPAVQYWYGQQVYYATQKDPRIDEREALAAPYKVSKEAQTRGTTIHSLIEAYKQSGAVISSVPEPLQGYAQAFYTWIDTVKPEILECERTVICEDERYAGTLDMLCAINGKKYVVDFKTSKDGSIYQEAHMQVSAYLHCLDDVEGGIIVSLSKDGKPTHQHARNGYEAFKACLKLYTFLQHDKLLALGWAKE